MFYAIILLAFWKALRFQWQLLFRTGA